MVAGASGPYWQWIQVQRSEVGANVRDGKGDPVKLSPKEVILKGDFLAKLEAASIFLIGTDASDKELTQLRDEVLIPLIESHRRYPSTMVPNPPLKKKDGVSE